MRQRGAIRTRNAARALVPDLACSSMSGTVSISFGVTWNDATEDVLNHISFVQSEIWDGTGRVLHS